MTDETASYRCPSCGERNTIRVDFSAGGRQEYVEDCSVCCRPNLLQVEFTSRGRAAVTAVPD